MSNQIPCINCICLAICKSKQGLDQLHYLFSLFNGCYIMREYLNRNGTYKSYYEYEKVDGTIMKLPLIIYDPIRIDKAKAFFNITNPKGVI